MTPTKNFNRIALCLILFFSAFTVTLANATSENNYKNDNNFLTNISETTHTENGYKANIIINPDATGIYALENEYRLDLTINTQGIGGSLKENNYKLDLVPEKTFPEIPERARIANARTSKDGCKPMSTVSRGYNVTINITVLNEGIFTQNFTFTIYANSTIIRTTTLFGLVSGTQATVTFSWNTTGFDYGNYTIWAYAWTIAGEINTADDTFISGLILVTIPGDINGDFRCEGRDNGAVSKAYDTRPGDLRWNSNADINNDGKVEGKDVGIVSKYYDTHYP